MSQESVTQESSTPSQGTAKSDHDKSSLGPLLCWAVVFADIGTSVYYTPGILYQTVHSLAGFFVFLTMSVFVLLTLKYAEVTQRFPQGGGVVTVAAQALNHWVGAVGGMFILVDYFLTAAISSLSGMLYLSVVIPAIGPIALWITIGVLILLGILNWVGISESAKVSLVGAIVAFVSDLAILVTVFTHISILDFFGLVGEMFANGHLTGTSLLIGFAGSFLAFSGLESISQLSPVMKTPRKKVASRALLMVVLTIGITSPLLTILSTLLLPQAAASPTESAQIISLLAGHWGSIALQTEVAISASALLVFASNTAIIGAYHVFLALARMDFFPEVVLQRNRLRGTPHFAILIATGIPIAVLIAVNGRIDILGDMYAFGLLGAFSLTCLGLDVIRYRERRNAHRLLKARERGGEFVSGSEVEAPLLNGHDVESRASTDAQKSPMANLSSNSSSASTPSADGHQSNNSIYPHTGVEPEFARENILGAWSSTDYVLGIITTVLVLLAWGTNLVAKPLATLFGGTFSLLGMGIAYVNYRHHERGGRTPVVITGIEGRMPDAILALLTGNEDRDQAVVQSAISESDGHPVVFLYVSDRKRDHEPQMFEVVDPYLDDTQAKAAFGRAEHKARNRKIPRRYIYRMGARDRVPAVVSSIWQVVHPHDTIVSADDVAEFENINPDRVRYELTPQGKVAHLLKRW